MANLIDFMNNGISNIADTAGRFYTKSLRYQTVIYGAVNVMHGQMAAVEMAKRKRIVLSIEGDDKRQM